MDNTFKSGYIAVIGRPNVGKSTLINALLGQKIAAVSPKPQTTRRQQLGILSTEEYQIVFMDTPGIHNPHHKLGQALNQIAEDALEHVDAILWLVDVSARPTDEEKMIAELLGAIRRRPTLILGLNKMDLVPAEVLESNRAMYLELSPDALTITLSATTGLGFESLLQILIEQLPSRPPDYPIDQVTDLFERDITADLIREACLYQLRDEVPHSIDIRIDEFTERENEDAFIAATIFVERESQKGIVIGKGGSMLKEIGSAARKEIEAMSGRKIFLQLRVKVLKDWRNQEHLMRRFGYQIKK